MSSGDDDIIDAVLEDVRAGSTRPVPADAAQAEARAGALHADATTALVPRREAPLFGSASFFERAGEELLSSTQHALELAGTAYARVRAGRTVLVGLRRCTTGMPGRVPIDPVWREILWHTHPGLRGSRAAPTSRSSSSALAASPPR